MKAQPPTTLKRPRRTASVTLHLSPDEKAKVDQAAFDKDLGTSQFVRRILLKALDIKAEPDGSNN